MKNLRSAILGTSRDVILAIAGVAAVLGLMLYQLVSLMPGLSVNEVAVYNSAHSPSAITDNMVNAPYKSAVFISTKIFEVDFGVRLVGALVGTLAVILFFFLVKELFGTLIGLATTVMFATSSLLLGMSRTATPNIMLLSLLAIIAVAAYIRFGKRTDIGWITAAFVIGLSLYVPGIFLFVLPVIIWKFKYARDSIKTINKPAIITASAIFAILLIPILLSLITDPAIWKGYVGINGELNTITIMAKYAYAAVASIFVISPIDSAYWLGRQPILDVFATAMFICGAFSLIKHYKLDRLWLILGVAFLSIVWIGATTNRYGVIILLPFIYLVIGAGLRMLTDEWFSVFPKNPIAKYIGAGLLVIAIAVSVNFQLHRFFVAWPNNEATRQAFSEQTPTTR